METVRNLLRIAYMAIGGLMVFSGVFWALQGLGIIMWPPESFMLADRAWTLYGSIWAEASRSAGRSRMKRAPWPRALSIVRSPPIARASRREM
jgi:hypothetical protein